MRRIKQIKLLMSLAILLIGLAIHSTATGQTIDSVATSPATRAAATDCESQLKTALERLDKTLDAYEKAVAALNAAQGEIAARKTLSDLKDQYIAVKDLIIATQDDLIKRLQKKDNSLWAKVKKALEVAEKIALVALGVSLGSR